MTEQKIDTWAVTVNVNNEDVLTIGHSHVSGIADFDDVAQIIRTCAAHLLSFIGEGPDHVGNHIALPRAILQAVTRDDFEARFIAEHGHRLASLFGINAFDLADRDAQIMAVLAANRDAMDNRPLFSTRQNAARYQWLKAWNKLDGWTDEMIDRQIAIDAQVVAASKPKGEGND